MKERRAFQSDIVVDGGRFTCDWICLVFCEIGLQQMLLKHISCDGWRSFNNGDILPVAFEKTGSFGGSPETIAIG